MSQSELRRPLQSPLFHPLRQRLHRAHSYDIDPRGLYDARFDCLTLWWGPQDKPGCGNTQMVAEDMSFPRRQVASPEWK